MAVIYSAKIKYKISKLITNKINFTKSLRPSVIGVKMPKKNKPGPTLNCTSAITFLSQRLKTPHKTINTIIKISVVIIKSSQSMYFISLLCLTVSHKMIGLSYLVLAIMCGFVGYVYSLFIRLELSLLGCGVLFGDYQFYNVIITSHGLIMIFAFIMPVMTGGFTNYYAPVMVGFPDMVFPRLNNMSF
jgi:hypothetical protein